MQLKCSSSYSKFPSYSYKRMFLFVNKLKSNHTLTSDLELTVLSGAKHRMSQAEPWQLLTELRQEIVCNEAYNSGQDVQDETKSRLWMKSKKMKKVNKHEKSDKWNLFFFFFH